MTDHICSIVFGSFLAYAGWFLGFLAEAQAFIPPEVWQGGASFVMVSGLTYAVVHLWRALRQEQGERLNDRHKHMEELRDQLEKSAASREALAGELRRLVVRVAHMEHETDNPQKETARVRLRKKDEEDDA
jgi:hypothetical protein